MTTALYRPTRDPGVPVLLGTTFFVLVIGAATALVGLFAGSAPAAYGAITGSLMAVFIFSFGASSVSYVARAMPGASLVFALLTYSLQLLLLGMLLVLLRESGLLEDALSADWVAGGLITCTLAWIVGQIWTTTRQRIPAYDLSRTVAPEAGAQ